MGLDLWFREDVARMLSAAQETVDSSLSAVTAACPQEAAAYQRGFVDALRAVGLGFGIAMPTSLGQTRVSGSQHFSITGDVHERVIEGRVRSPHGDWQP